MTELLVHPFAMLCYGLAAHFLKHMSQQRVSGKPITPRAYWLAHPYHSALSVVGALAGYAALIEAGQLTGLTAFGVGYMANSMADVLGQRAAGRMG